MKSQCMNTYAKNAIMDPKNPTNAEDCGLAEKPEAQRNANPNAAPDPTSVPTRENIYAIGWVFLNQYSLHVRRSCLDASGISHEAFRLNSSHVSQFVHRSASRLCVSNRVFRFVLFSYFIKFLCFYYMKPRGFAAGHLIPRTASCAPMISTESATSFDQWRLITLLR